MDHTASSSAQPAPAPPTSACSSCWRWGSCPPGWLTENIYIRSALIFLKLHLRRDDFEPEHDNEAEVLVSSIEAAGTAGGAGLGRLEPEEEQLEAGLKLAHMKMYQTKLRYSRRIQ